MPGEETVAGRQTRDGEDFDRLVREERRQRLGRDARIAQGEGRQRDDLPLLVA